jgi:hypothetical protein
MRQDASRTLRGIAPVSHGLRLLLAYLAATAATAALGSVVQTQFNLAALQSLGATIAPGTRLLTTAQDIAGFAPLWAAVLALGFLIAFVCATVLAWFLPGRRTALLILAGAVSVFVTLWVMKVALPITLIAATRELAGFVLIGLTGLLGGWLYARLSRRVAARVLAGPTGATSQG